MSGRRVVTSERDFIRRKDKVMEMEVGFSEKYMKLKGEYAYLKEESASQIELYNNLVTVVGPNLAAQYMVQLGMLEYQVFELTIEMRRWQRRLTLRQAAVNRGEKPNLVAIERQLDAEFEEFKKKVLAHRREMQNAADKWRREKMSDTDMTELRMQYLNAVKRLHPDINENLSENAKELWDRIQEAYKNKDWADLRFLVGLVEGVVAGETFENSEDGISRLEKRCQKLRGVCADLRAQMTATREKKPFCYQAILEDPDGVTARQDALREQIEELNSRISECEENWKDECYGE